MKTSAWLIGALLLAGSFFCSSAPAQKQSAHSTKIKSYYREKIAPDIQPKALWDGRKLMPFHAANFPKMLPASAAGFLDENEYVLGLTVNGESRAYPTRYAAFHHIINDSVGRPDQGGKQFVAVTYCVVCNSGVRFDPVVNGRLLKFDFYGIYNGVVTMYDRNTKSVWLQIGGRAIKGPMCGTELKTGPLLDTTWGRWKTLHPDTLVMAPEARYSEYYEPEGEPVPRGFTSFPGSYFPKSITHRDTRLPTFAMVLTVTVPQPPADVLTASDTTATRTPALYRAYPLKTLKASSGSVNDMLGTTPIAVFFEPKTVTATAVSRVLNGRTLTFEARKEAGGKRAFYDKETGTRWSIEGKAEAGPLAGQSLQRVESHLSRWYGWVSYFPETSIYGRAEPPQTLTFSSRSLYRTPNKLSKRD